jgi:CBS domain-containing protein
MDAAIQLPTLHSVVRYLDRHLDLIPKRGELASGSSSAATSSAAKIGDVALLLKTIKRNLTMITVREDETALEGFRRMVSHGVSGLPVVNR